MTDQPPPGNYPPPPPGGYPPPPPGGYPPPPGPGAYPPMPAGYPGPGWQGAQPTPPDSNLVWAILSTVLCCLPLGIVAIVKSTQVSGLWAQGRYADAQRASDDAKKFAMWGAIAGLVVGVIYVVFAISGAMAGMSSY